MLSLILPSCCFYVFGWSWPKMPFPSPVSMLFNLQLKCNSISLSFLSHSLLLVWHKWLSTLYTTVIKIWMNHRKLLMMTRVHPMNSTQLEGSTFAKKVVMNCFKQNIEVWEIERISTCLTVIHVLFPNLPEFEA